MIRFVRSKRSVILAVCLILCFALTRVPGVLPDNFSAVYALALCAGLYLPGRTGWVLPMSVLIATDFILNVFFYPSAHAGWLWYLLPNYAAYLALIWMGKRLTSQASWIYLLGAGLMGAILFYVITNTGSWLANPEYAKTLGGWIQALTVGTQGWPHTWEFFRNTLLSGGLFTGLFVGAMKAAEAGEQAEEEEEESEASGSEESEPEKA